MTTAAPSKPLQLSPRPAVAPSDSPAKNHGARCSTSAGTSSTTSHDPGTTFSGGESTPPASGYANPREQRRSGRGYEKDSSDQTVAALEELASRPEVRFRALEVLTGLEDYCAEPDFTNAVTDFFLAESAVFDDREEDFPLEWYTSFQKYGVLLESLLNGFVRDEGSETRDVEEESRITCSHEELEFVCQMFLRQLEADNNPLMCSDYILASLDYDDFVRVAQDHRRLYFGDDRHGGADDLREDEDYFPPQTTGESENPEDSSVLAEGGDLSTERDCCSAAEV